MTTPPPKPGSAAAQHGDDQEIRVFLVDDQQLVRGGFRMLIDAQPDMSVVGEASDGGQAVAALTRGRVHADVVLMDIRMPGVSGVEATEQLLAPGPAGAAARDENPKILVLTTFDLDEYVFAALKAGASGFLLKDARPEELLGAIRAVSAGDAVVAPSATRRLLDHVLTRLPDGREATDPRIDLLTAREREVLVHVASGKTNTEIAAELYMAEATVKTHIGHLFSKLGCRDRVGLVIFAYTTGLVGR